jgi:hypothetical protein
MKKTLIALAITFSATQLHAETSHNFMSENKTSLGYSVIDVDAAVLGGDVTYDLSGYAVSLGNQWDNGIYLRLDYNGYTGDASAKVNDVSIGFDSKLYTLGLVTGWQYSLTPNGRLFAEVGYQALGLQLSNFGTYMEDDVTDYVLGAGYKHQFGNLVTEVNTQYFNGDSQFGAELLYAFNSNFAVATGLNVRSDETSYNAQIIYGF